MRPRKILCVDDQRFIHRWEESLLAGLIEDGTEIIHAYDGLEALRRLVEHPDTDLILLDLNMPTMNGLAFLEQRRNTRIATIPVIVITAEGSRPEEVSNAIALGASTVLSKPFDAVVLARAIGKLFDPRADDSTH
jgi:sigma-B regulation protein RsbU (phosphoserine phosphatase)